MRNLKGMIGLAAAATLALTAVPAVAVAQDGEALDICFIHEDLETEFWLAGHKAMTETLATQGHNVITKYSPDANVQLELQRDCIAQGVDGIFVIPKDGSIALTLIEEANAADIPIGIFNRPPQSEDGAAIVVQADNQTIARDAVQYIYEVAKEMGKESVTPLIMVGDLGDPNAVGRYQGFYDVVDSDPEFFGEPIEVATNWDAGIAQAGLQAALAANPDVDFLFTSSDFLFPTIATEFEKLGKWVTRDDPNHVLMAGLDGDVNACRQIKEGYVDSTGVQNLYFEAEVMLDALLKAIEEGNTQPDEWIPDPGFALTAGNLAEREMDMWGCILLADPDYNP
jgi:inositol transport system substrate-binding protein